MNGKITKSKRAATEHPKSKRATTDIREVPRSADYEYEYVWVGGSEQKKKGGGNADSLRTARSASVQQHRMVQMAIKIAAHLATSSRTSSQRLGQTDRCLFVCFIEFKGFPRQDLRSPDRGDLRNGFVVCDCELDKD